MTINLDTFCDIKITTYNTFANCSGLFLYLLPVLNMFRRSNSLKHHSEAEVAFFKLRLTVLGCFHHYLLYPITWTILTLLSFTMKLIIPYNIFAAGILSMKHVNCAIVHVGPFATRCFF